MKKLDKQMNTNENEIIEQMVENTKKPQEKEVFEFFGRVITKKKIKQPAGRFAGQIRYNLIVEIYDNPKVDTIQIMKEKVPEYIWEATLNSDYYGRNWVFYCHRRGERYRLFDWKEDSKITDEGERVEES